MARDLLVVSSRSTATRAQAADSESTVLAEGEPAASLDSGPASAVRSFQLPPEGLVFEDLERDLVRQALERTGFNQTRAAKLLGMTRDQIRYRVRKFALGRGEASIEEP
jgi:transcriptional regulator with GAF, ATPase, and Fis domain